MSSNSTSTSSRVVLEVSSPFVISVLTRLELARFGQTAKHRVISLVLLLLIQQQDSYLVVLVLVLIAV